MRWVTDPRGLPGAQDPAHQPQRQQDRQREQRGGEAQ
jgi:hypothetical protein